MRGDVPELVAKLITDNGCSLVLLAIAVELMAQVQTDQSLKHADILHRLAKRISDAVMEFEAGLRQ